MKQYIDSIRHVYRMGKDNDMHLLFYLHGFAWELADLTTGTSWLFPIVEKVFGITPYYTHVGLKLRSIEIRKG